jgi:hypothetical protein
MASTINWRGASGREYRYWIYPIDSPFQDEPGNYIFAKETRPRAWSPVYVGQTGSLADRLADHEKELCARRSGATHIHVHTNSQGEMPRRTEESDLIKKWQPTCNG